MDQKKKCHDSNEMLTCDCLGIQWELSHDILGQVHPPMGSEGQQYVVEMVDFKNCHGAN